MKKLVTKVKELIQKVKNIFKRQSVLGYFDRIKDEADKTYRETGIRQFVFLSDVNLVIMSNKNVLAIKNKERCSWKQIKDSAMYFTESKKEKAMSERDIKLRKEYYVREIHGIK
jgi:hypothetical protein